MSFKENQDGSPLMYKTPNVEPGVEQMLNK